MNTTTLPDDASEAPNVVTVAAARTTAVRHSAFNSTTLTLNGSQKANFVTDSDQCAAPQAAQQVAPQVNDDDDDDGDDNDYILSQNMSANGFLNVANCVCFDFNTEKLHGILCHIANGDNLWANFAI